MLEEREKLFIDYWEIHSEREGRFWVQLLTGLPVGLLFALPVVLLLFSARFWYKRADMVANTQMSMGVLIVALLLIAGFVAVIYKRHQWEMKDEQYKRLKAKEKKQQL